MGEGGTGLGISGPFVCLALYEVLTDTRLSFQFIPIPPLTLGTAEHNSVHSGQGIQGPDDKEDTGSH